MGEPGVRRSKAYTTDARSGTATGYKPTRHMALRVRQAKRSKRTKRRKDAYRERRSLISAIHCNDERIVSTEIKSKITNAQNGARFLVVKIRRLVISKLITIAITTSAMRDQRDTRNPSNPSFHDPAKIKR